MTGIEENASHASLNRLLRHTVGIVNSIRTVGIHPLTGRQADTEEPGTGCAVRWCGHHFILTARHVVEKAQPKDLRVYSYPVDGIEFRSPRDLRIGDIAEGEPLNDANAVIHLCDWEDLAVVTVAPDAFPGLEFVDVLIASIDPSIGETVHCCGFPSDHNVTVGKKVVGSKEEVDIALYPTVHSGVVLPIPSEEELKFKITDFNPDLHYLVPYEVSPLSRHPRGTSGAAMWWESDEKMLIWRPNFKFAGVCTACYMNGTVVQVAKASVARRFLEEVFGPAGP